MARPSKYETHVKPRLSEVADWVRNGASDREVAERLRISADSLIEYKKRFSEFSECLTRTRAYVDAEVENALLKRALGYTYDEVIKEVDEVGRRRIKTVTREVIPDITAQMFWLKNRRPEKWRDRSKRMDEDSTDDNGFVISIEDCT